MLRKSKRSSAESAKNFIGRTHEEIVAYRAAWQAEIGAEPADPPTEVSYPD